VIALHVSFILIFMFRLLTYENWFNWVPFLAFGVTAAVFFSFVVRAMMLKKESAERMSRLPLDD
jgi:hypothetical protein